MHRLRCAVACSQQICRTSNTTISSPHNTPAPNKKNISAKPTAQEGTVKRACLQKNGVAVFPSCRGRCVPLWAVVPSLQGVSSSACSVASLGHCPGDYLPGHSYFRRCTLAVSLLGRGRPSTRSAARASVRSAPPTHARTRHREALPSPASA